MDLRLCAHCTTHSAHHFCTCSEVLLCQDCLPIHLAKSQGLHQILPLQACDSYKKQGYMKRLQQRAAAIEAGKAALGESLGSIDCCLAEFTEKVNDVVQTIWTRAYGLTAQLAKEKQELQGVIQRSIEEAGRTLYEDFPSLREPYSAYLREYDGSVPCQLFTYTVTAVELALSPLLSYSFPPIVRPTTPYFVGLHGNSMLVMDLATGNQRLAHLPIFIDAYTRYCLLTPHKLLSTKGTQALTITLDSQEIQPVASLHVEHWHPGLIVVEKTAFVFGGRTVHCERLNTDMVWENLADMGVARRGFCPCLHREWIYLPEMHEATSVEAYSLAGDCFRLLPFSLPNIFSNSVSFMTGNILTGKSIPRPNSL